jgi:hypothetical protein
MSSRTTWLVVRIGCHYLLDYFVILGCEFRALHLQTGTLPLEPYLQLVFTVGCAASQDWKECTLAFHQLELVSGTYKCPVIDQKSPM